ncbi:MAG: UvrD-helicase domain-containing protein, partial [bacterium]
MYNNVLKTDKELEFPHIFQLSASAGSGKTHNLSLRYVQFLLSSDIKSNNIKTNNLNNIIAITFTNKAANEMKERILKLLKSIAIGDKQALEQVKQVICFGEDSNGAKYAFEKKASALVDNIIKNYSDFNVKTIDSFLTDIIKASLLETDIRPGFSIIMDSTVYIESALDKLLLNANANVNVNEEDKEITNIFIEFVKNYTAIEGKNNFNPRSAIIDIVKELRNIENTKGKYFKVQDDKDYLIKAHKYIAKNIKNIYEKPFEVDTLETLSNCGGKLQELANSIDYYNNTSANFRGGDNSKNKNKNCFNDSNSNSAKSSKKIASKSKEIKLNKNALKGLAKIAGMNFSSAYLLKNNVKEIITNAKSLESIEILNKLQQTWDSIRANIKNIILTVNGVKFYSYIKILKEIKKIIAVKSKNDGNIFIDELKIRVNELIRDNRVPDIYFNIGEKIYHYLIDEFQDTDRLQWENIKALVENSIANGGTFFYVGDKKQSIYRFKGSDADLFDSVIDDFRNENIIHENNFYEEKLFYNFRSEKELINFFNNTFNPENLILNLLNENIFNKQHNPLNLISLTDSIDGLVNKNIIYLINKVYKDHIQEPPNGDYKNKNSGKNFKGYVYIERILEKKEEYKDNKEETGKTKETKNNKDINDIKNNNDVNDDNNSNNNIDNYSNNEDNAPAAINSQEIKGICLDKTIDIIKDIKSRNYNYKDIAILTRTNQESSDIVLRLKREKIPAESEQNADIRNNALIKEVISFIKFLNKPADNLSFLNFISGAIFASIFNKPNELMGEIPEIRQSNQFNQSDFYSILKNEINNFVAQNRKKEFIYLYFKKWIQKILENNDNTTNTDNIWNYYFEPLMNSVGYYPPYDIVCMFYQKFNIYEIFKNDSGFFMHLLELLKNREQEGENSLESFLYFFENSKYEEKLFLVKLNSAKDAVNVLTMHKSKGLQFPAVIIPYAGIKIDSPNEIIIECSKSICAGNEYEEYNQHDYNKNINDDSYYNNDSNSYNNGYNNTGSYININSDSIELDYADKISQDFLFSIIKDIIKNKESNLNLNVNLDKESDLKSISGENKTVIESVISYVRQKSLNFIDELNLFYVTLTRAEKELYILIPPKIGNNKNKLINLFF